MADIKDPHVFTDGMDLDSESRNVAPSSTRMARNCRYDDAISGNAGASVNLLGNELVDYVLGYGGNRVCGQCPDYKRGEIIYFVQNSNSINHIISYNPETKVHTGIISWVSNLLMPNPVLDWNERTMITGANVVGDLLFWIDPIPRCVNIEKAKLVGRPGGYTKITSQTIIAIKYPPTISIVAKYETDNSYIQNNLRGKVFQFRYRYVYSDYSKSTCSPISKVPVPDDAYAYNGELLTLVSCNNIINLYLFSGSEDVIDVEILFRESNVGDWMILDRLNKDRDALPTSGVFTYKFRNDKRGEGVDQQEVNRPFDYVPITAGAQEFIDNKYMSYANCEEGFDVESVSLAVYDVQNEMPTDQDITGHLHTYTQTDSNYGHNESYYNPSDENTYTTEWTYIGKIIDVSTFGLTTGNIVKVKLEGKTIYHWRNDIGDEQFDYAVVEKYIIINLTTSVRDQFIGLVNAIYPTDSNIVATDVDFNGNSLGADILMVRVPAPSTYSGNISFYKVDNIITRAQFSVFETGNILRQQFAGAKQGQRHKFGIVYKDQAGRKSTVFKNGYGFGEVYIPFITEPSSINKGKIWNNIRHSIWWEIHSIPPLWAHSYSIVYCPDKSIESYMQYVIGPRNNEGGEDITIEHGSGVNFGYTFIDINYWNTLSTPNSTKCDYCIENTRVVPYVWKKGDRIRFITVGQVSPKEPPGYLVLDKYFDLEIIGEENDVDGASTGRLKVQRSEKLDDCGIGAGSVVEIYTPGKILSEDVYYEIGEDYEILNPGTPQRNHQGSFSDQIFPQLLSPACGEISKLNTFYVLRASPYAIGSPPDEKAGTHTFYCESSHYSDFFDSEAFDYGAINIYDGDAKREVGKKIRRSQSFFENTRINGLSTFYYDDFIPLSDRYGAIASMKQVGFTLKVLQEHKLTSIYIGVNGLKQAKIDGQDVVVSSDNVFNNVNQSEESYGCANPESVLVSGRNLYWYDASNGCIVRDTPNGTEDLSAKYKISSLVKKFILNGDMRVISGYDKRYEEVIFSLQRMDDVELPVHTGITVTKKIVPTALIGDEIGGGTLFYKDETDTWGLVVYPELIVATNGKIYGTVGTESNAQYTGLGEGTLNQDIILGLETSGNSFFETVRALTLGGHDDWYVPDLFEIYEAITAVSSLLDLTFDYLNTSTENESSPETLFCIYNKDTRTVQGIGDKGSDLFYTNQISTLVIRRVILTNPTPDKFFKITATEDISGNVHTGWVHPEQPLVFNDIPYDNYVISEEEAEGYSLVSITPSSVYINAGLPEQSVEVVNDSRPYSIEVIKEFPEGVTDDTEFTITLTGQNTSYEEVKIIKQSQSALFDNLAADTYEVTEAPVEGYENISITPSSVTLTNAEPDMEVVVVNQEISSLGYGQLYNWYAATDERGIANGDFEVPEQSDFETLIEYVRVNFCDGDVGLVGGVLKEMGFVHWLDPNIGATNELNFNAVGGGIRSNDGGFNWIKEYSELGTVTESIVEGRYKVIILLYNSSIAYNEVDAVVLKEVGVSYTIFRPSTASEQLLTDGTYVDNYIGNDGKSYRCVKIGTQVWMAENLNETLYNNLDPIPEVTDNTAWSELTTGGRCYYDNDSNNA